MLVQLKGTHTLVWFDPALHFESRLHLIGNRQKKTSIKFQKKDQRVLEKQSSFFNSKFKKKKKHNEFIYLDFRNQFDVIKTKQTNGKMVFYGAP